MPGIMPMKIIKVGGSSQSRVAQACDRCRSKKIRCDGITPCCTQCANVGFECKTSDKLSRRAFPRGYTESLEERVRQLEAEVRELKGLLDEKDEKIDLLSKFHDFGKRRRSGTSSIEKTTSPTGNKRAEDEDHFTVRQPSTLTKTSGRTEPHWAGASSSTAFLDVFREKAAAVGRMVPPISPRALFSGRAPNSKRPLGGHARRPPRLVSDRLVNLFFQEFAPLLPVLYRPAFLQRYREFAEGTDNIENHHAVAQLNLVFSIAATACDFGREHVAAFDNHWQSALKAVIHDSSLSTLQCLVLAQLCCLCKDDNNKVLHYAGLSVVMSRQLGLHQSQAGLSLEVLTAEMRKRVFWCLYTVDTFTAACLGLPRLVKDEVVHTEFPSNIDDEDLCEQRFSSANAETKMSAALSFFTLARIFGRALDAVYQAPVSRGVSKQTVSTISGELDEWRESLAPHLRLVFAQDKPSTRVTGDRSPLLSLAYYHIQALLHRPLAISDSGEKAISSVIALADASKHIVQLVQLLNERHMSFSLPLNRNEVLVNAGLGLLYQGMTIPDGKSLLVSDSHRLVCGIISILDNSGAPCAHDFKVLACSLITVDIIAARRLSSRQRSTSPLDDNAERSPDRPKSFDSNSPRRTSSGSAGPAPQISIAQRRSQQPGKLFLQQNATAVFAQQQSMIASGVLASRSGLTPVRSEPSLRHSAQTSSMPSDKRPLLLVGGPANLDYLPFGSTPSPGANVTPTASGQNQSESQTAQWERIIDCLAQTEAPVANSLAPGSTARSSPMDIFGSDQLGLDQQADNIWQDPTSATTWGTDSTGVPSVFDDSGASFTSGDDSNGSVIVSNPSKDLDVFTTGIELTNALGDDFTADIQGLEVELAL